jgi:hypothetical protein
MDANAKYTIKDLAGRIIATANSLKELRDFWLKPEAQNLSIVQEFGRKGKYLVFIVKEIK